MKEAVYVGETGRSIYERAGEHWNDRLTGKDDSHMIKHWKISHPDLPEPPAFKIRVVAGYPDALSRQIAESVRIDMRGDKVLNSKTEYSRCRIPRMTIDREEWKEKKKQEVARMEDRVGDLEVELDLREIGGAAWQLGGVRENAKRKNTAQPGRASKRKKMDKLVDWGSEVKSSVKTESIRRWLI
jgi:hypothetical protein